MRSAEAGNDLIVLGIETSCDETSAALVGDGPRILSSVVASQADLHARWGGVVPEVASRMHVERILPAIADALQEAGVAASDVGAIAVTNRPGLIGALVVGVACAKALAYAWGVPLLAVHHVIAHLHAARLADPSLKSPFLCLVVSGGHTELIVAESDSCYYTVGRTRDDAAGECFDKCARLMGLPYPGGPELERLAQGGDPNAVAFPRAMLGGSLDFSFSGLKTAVSRYLKQYGGLERIEDVAASLQAAIVDVLVTKTLMAAEATGMEQVAVGGGVAANRAFTVKLAEACRSRDLKCVVPPVSLCTDNAAMVAAAAFDRAIHGDNDGLGFDTLATDHLQLRVPEKVGVAQ